MNFCTVLILLFLKTHVALMSISRRKFTGSLFALPLLLQLPLSASEKPINLSSKNKYPTKLNPGDTVALISPCAATFTQEPIDIAVEALEKCGLKVKKGKHLMANEGHLAGTDKQRASDLNNAFADDDISAVICLRGGSGAARVLPLIDYNTIKKNPKIIVGYSDVTALLLSIYAKTGLVTFHGQNGIASWTELARKYYFGLLFENKQLTFEKPDLPEANWVRKRGRTRTIQKGTASGILMGGNLTVLCGMLGSDYLPDFKGAILFLEDTNEELYRIDRLMAQLMLAGILDNISGFIFGHCTNCQPGRGYGTSTFDQIMDHYIKPLEIPAFSGAMIGHIESQFTLPLGIKTEMDAEKGTFKLLEKALHE